MASSPTVLRGAPAEPDVAVMAAGRRIPRSFAVAVFAAVLGALLFASAFSGLDHRRTVLAVTRNVSAGDVLTAEDLRPVKVGADRGLALVGAAGRSRVIGRVAAVPLTADSLLTSAQVGSASQLAAGEAVVGVLLEPGRYPPGLRSGDRVAVVSAPGGVAISNDPPSTITSGVVESTDPAPGSGGVVVRLRLPTDTAPMVAGEAAARRVSVVLVAPTTPETHR